MFYIFLLKGTGTLSTMTNTWACFTLSSICFDSDSCGEGTSDCSNDSDQCEFGPNLSLLLFRYQFMRPVDRRCTYCGAYKGKPAKTILECTRDGRNLCPRCYPDCYRRHRKYFK